MTAQLRGDYPLSVICRVLQVPRGSVYVHDQRVREGEHAANAEMALRAHIEQIATTWPTYGYRRVTAQLRREAEPIAGTNSKRVRRLLHELGLPGTAPARRRTRTTDRAHPYPRYPHLVRDLEGGHRDHVWVGAITYVRLQLEFVSLALLLDVFPRASRGWELARSLDQARPLTALERARQQGHVPAIHHSDPGACSTRPRPISPVWSRSGVVSAWPRWASRARTAMPSGSCAASKRRKSS